MPLKTLVKVGSITNLSDARYCAGMGVDMLGFNVVPGTENHISSALYQDIRGWISGPVIVAEMYSITTDSPASVIQMYAPAYIETDFSMYLSLKGAFDLPFIVAAASISAQEITSHPAVAYWIVDLKTAKALSSQVDTSKLLVKVDSVKEAQDILGFNGKQGVALRGSQEMRPGFKNYGELSEILELLDE